MPRMSKYRKRKFSGLVEEWEKKQHIDHHLRSELFTVLRGAKNLMSVPLEIKFNALSSTTGMEAVKAARRVIR